MGFYLVRSGGFSGLALDHVRIQRALGQKVDLSQLVGFLLEYSYEFLANPLSLDFRVRDALKRRKEPLRFIGVDEFQAEIAGKQVLDPFGLGSAHQSVVHEDACEPVANGPVDQGGGDSRVDAAGKRAYHSSVAHLCPNVFYSIAHEVGRGPRALTPANLEGEISNDLGALRGVGDFRMELDAIHSEVVSHNRDGRILRRRPDTEARGQFVDPVSVAHPDGYGRIQTVQ